MKSRAWHLKALFFAVFVSGCIEKENVDEQRVLHAREKLDALYRSYVTHDADGAKRDMATSIELLMPLTNSASIDASEGLRLAYARLYCIEVALGDTNRS